MVSAGVVLSRNADRHRKGEHMAETNKGGFAMPDRSFPGINTSDDALRDYFAAVALMGLIVSAGPEAMTTEKCADTAYGYANAMMKLHDTYTR